MKMPKSKIRNRLDGLKFDVKAFGKEYRCKFRTGKYSHGNRLAIQAVICEDNSPFAFLTVNLPDHPLAINEIFVKTWSENEEFAKACMATGLFEDTGERIPTGFVEAQVWRIKGE
jgi:hypothetical protein